MGRHHALSGVPPQILAVMTHYGASRQYSEGVHAMSEHESIRESDGTRRNFLHQAAVLH